MESIPLELVIECWKCGRSIRHVVGLQIGITAARRAAGGIARGHKWRIIKGLWACPKCQPPSERRARINKTKKRRANHYGRGAK